MLLAKKKLHLVVAQSNMQLGDADVKHFLIV
jgi:hypothetical protein